MGRAGQQKPNRLFDLSACAETKCILSDVDNGVRSILPYKARTVPKYCIGPVSYFVYGNQYAIVQMDGGENFQYIIFNDGELAHEYREHFHVLWDIASPLLSSVDKNDENNNTVRA